MYCLKLYFIFSSVLSNIIFSNVQYGNVLFNVLSVISSHLVFSRSVLLMMTFPPI